MELPKADLRLSVEEYLIAERRSEVRHEYLGGAVYPIAESSEEHNVVIGNLGTLLHSHLRGRPCRTFMTDMKSGSRSSVMKCCIIPTSWWPAIRATRTATSNATPRS